MKIAVFYELHHGGARRAANEQAKRITDKHQVDLYFIDSQNSGEEKKYYTRTYYFPFIPKLWMGKNWRLKIYKDTIELFLLYRLHKKVAKTINDKNYDIVIIHPSQFTQAPFILRFITSKKIYYCHEPLRIVYESIFDIQQNLFFIKKWYEKINRWLRKQIDKKNISYADAIFANSKFTKKNIFSSYNLPSKVCYFGVDTDQFASASETKKYDILFIGGFGKIDGYSWLEKSIQFMNHRPRVMVHTGVKWISSQKEFVRLYSQARIVVCFAYNEPFGLIPLEAMACGVPVVAINEGGYKETIINNETGYLVSRSPKEVARALDRLLMDQAKRKKMGVNARQHVLKNWDWKKRITDFEIALQNIQL